MSTTRQPEDRTLRDELLLALCTDHGHALREAKRTCRTCIRRVDILMLIVDRHRPPLQGIIDGPGFDSKDSLVDLYEVDATIRSFASRDEADEWLAGVLAEQEKDDEE